MIHTLPWYGALEPENRAFFIKFFTKSSLIECTRQPCPPCSPVRQIPIPPIGMLGTHLQPVHMPKFVVNWTSIDGDIVGQSRAIAPGAAHGLPFCCFPARDGHRRRKPSHFSFPAGAAERGPRAPNTRSEPLPRQHAHRSNGSDDRGPPGLPPPPWRTRRAAHAPARILLAHRLRPRRTAGRTSPPSAPVALSQAPRRAITCATTSRCSSSAPAASAAR